MLRILVLGLDNAGKTSILMKLSSKDISTISPTQGFNIKTLIHDKFKLNVWDIGGQKAIRSYWKNYYKSTDAIIFVIDSSDKKRMKESQNEIKTIIKEDGLKGLPILILANKQDLINAMSIYEVQQNMSLEEAMGEVENRPWKLIGCSAKKGTGIEEGLSWIISSVNKAK